MKRDNSRPAASKEDAPRTKEKGRRALAVICCLLAALLFFTMGWFGHYLSLGGRVRSLLWAVDTAEQNFLGGVTEEELFEKFFGDLALDPYSEYYTREEYEAVYSRHEGKRADYGFNFFAAGEDLHIARITGNSPADRAGIEGGMYVLAFGADAEHLQTGGYDDFRTLLNSSGEVTVRCGFDEGGSDAALYTLSRPQTPYRAASCLYRDGEGALRFVGDGKASAGALEGIPADTAYLRIDEFYGTAAEETAAALAAMKARGKKNLILDLRNNGGGYLSVFQKIAACFLRDAAEERPVVAVSREKSGRETVWRAPANRFSEFFGDDAKIYVLANENTASASECLIGALVAYNAVPYGHIYLRAETGKTYGKGIMQSTYSDAEGNRLKLTNAQMYWPDGVTTIHGRGVTLADGAVAVEASVYPAAQDEFLRAVYADI